MSRPLSGAAQAAHERKQARLRLEHDAALLAERNAAVAAHAARTLRSLETSVFDQLAAELGNPLRGAA